jgi:pyruvate/2-oxoglutarate dehydrogenase complex dihydrolipoamide acyltransferase (E2) component
VSLDKLLRLSEGSDGPPDPDADLLLAVQAASRELALLLASDDADDGKKGPGGDDEGGGHASHATFKALRKRNVPPDRASAMCAKSDKNVKASQLARALDVMLSGRPGIDTALVTLTPESETAEGRKKAAKSNHALPDGSYPIEDKKHLHSAAVLAASGKGNASAAKALIRRRARELGVDVNSLPGFGGSDDDHEKAAASMVALAKQAVGDGGVAMHHAPFTGTHAHGHPLTAAHDHPHQHFGDNNHEGGPLHRPGSEPKRGW